MNRFGVHFHTKYRIVISVGQTFLPLFDHGNFLFKFFLFLLLRIDIFVVSNINTIDCRIVGSDDCRLLKIVSGNALQAFVDSNNNLSVICD